MLLRRILRQNTTTIGPPVKQAAAPKPAESRREMTTDEQAEKELITLAEIAELKKKGEPVILLDVRSERSFNDSDLLAKDAIRMNPDEAVRKVQELALDKQAWLIAFCA